MEGFIIPTAEEMRYLSEGSQPLIYDIDFAVDPDLGVDVIHLEVSLWVETVVVDNLIEPRLFERRLFRTPNVDACYEIVFQHFYNLGLKIPDYKVEAFYYGSPSLEFNDAMVALRNSYNVLGYNKLLGHVAHSITNW